jgi:hypothetical protein
MLEAEGLRVIEFPWSEQRGERASAAFWKLLEDGTFRHDGDPTLRSHVMGARVKESGRGWSFDQTAPRPVAGLFALAAACDEGISTAPAGDVFFGWA